MGHGAAFSKADVVEVERRHFWLGPRAANFEDPPPLLYIQVRRRNLDSAYSCEKCSLCNFARPFSSFVLWLLSANLICCHKNES